MRNSTKTTLKNKKTRETQQLIDQLQNPDQGQETSTLIVMSSKHNIIISLDKTPESHNSSTHYEKHIYYIPTELVKALDPLRNNQLDRYTEQLLSEHSLLHCIGEDEQQRAHTIKRLLSGLQDSSKMIEDYIIDRIMCKAQAKYQNYSLVDYTRRNEVIDIGKEIKKLSPQFKHYIDVIITDFLTTHRIDVTSPYKIIKNPFVVLHHFGYPEEDIQALEEHITSKDKYRRLRAQEIVHTIYTNYLQELHQQAAQETQLIITKKN